MNLIKKYFFHFYFFKHYQNLQFHYFLRLHFLYDKIQEGVITTLNQAIENQKEHERLNNRRAHSSNPSLDQQRFLFNNQHQIKIND